MIAHPLIEVANGTPSLISAPSPPYTLTQSVDQSVCQSEDQPVSCFFSSVSQLVYCLRLVRHLIRCSISLLFSQLFNHSFHQPVSQSLKQSASNLVTYPVSKLDSQPVTNLLSQSASQTVSQLLSCSVINFSQLISK